MKIIIELLKKDLLKFRWLLLLWLVLIVTWHAALFVLNGENFKVVFGCVTTLKILVICFLPVLTMLIMQADAAAGGAAFWLTRPLPPWKILASKTLLLLTLMLPLPVAIFVSTMALFHSSAVEVWRKTLDATEIWFVLMPLYVLLASVTRNFLTALGVMLALLVAFLVSAIISMNRVYVHLSWVAFIAVPLAGVIVQYHTRRAWLTVSGCVLAATVVTVFHPSLPSPNTRGAAASRDPQSFFEQITARNVTVSVHDGNVTVSGNFEVPAQRRFEWTIYSPLFTAADGETIVLRRVSTTAHSPGTAYVDDKMISSGGRKEFSFVLSSAELKKIRGKTGTLRVRIGGKFFHYEPLTVVPLDSKRWTVVSDTRITTAKPSEGADSDTVAEVLLFSAQKDDSALATVGYNYQYSLYRADCDGEIPLRSHMIVRVFDFSLGIVFVRLNARASLPENLDGWSIRIDRRVYDSKTTFGTVLTIPNFTASGTALSAAEKL